VLEKKKILNMSSLNQPCFCGSGKKYKRCHLNIPHKIERKVQIKKVVTNAIDFLNTKNLILKNKPNNFNEIKFVKNLEKLPKEIKDNVISKSNYFKPNYGECIPLSMFLSSSIENINLEIGLFKANGVGTGFLNPNPKKESWYTYKFRGELYNVFIDENGDKWGFHCWNSYNGVHFDILKDYVFKVDEPKMWIKYKQIQSVQFIPKSFEDKKIVKEQTIQRIW
jgi:hypothetical protein